MYRFFVYVPGMPVDANVMATRSLGGSESSGAYLCRELERRGHQVTMFSNVQTQSEWEKVNILPIGEISKDFPLGVNFERTAALVPHDVCIVQRHPMPFPRLFHSKLNYWWVHDLARGRQTPAFKNCGWNMQGVMAVTDWHKQQVMKTYGVEAKDVHVLRNGIDLDLFKTEPNYERKFRAKTLVYTSRPERGLINLVKEDGIMERLAKIDPAITLLVAFYDNAAPQLNDLYQYLFARCAALPNVEIIGPQSKAGVAQLMYDASLFVYPTVPAAEHEETSCISLMECQAAGTPFIVCDGGAVSETVGDRPFLRGALMPYREDGSADIDGFTKFIIQMLSGYDEYVAESKDCREFALANYGFEKPAAFLEDLVGHTLRDRSKGLRLAHHLFEQADSLLGLEVAKDIAEPSQFLKEELALYDFLKTPEGYKAHYERSAELFLKYSGLGDGSKLPDIDAAWQGGHFREILPLLEHEAQRGPFRVLDYGCGVGLLSLAIAKRFPQAQVVGADVSDQNVDCAARVAKTLNLGNVEFRQCQWPTDLADQFDIVLCAETMEHMREEPNTVSDALESLMPVNGMMILTLPASHPDHYVRAPGEEERREHVRYIEHIDAQEMWGKKPGYGVSFYPIKQNPWTAGPVAGAVLTWRADHKAAGEVNKLRKLGAQAPRETLGVLMIARWDEPAIEKTLQSVEAIADEIWIGVDVDVQNQAQSSEARGRWAEIAKKYPKMQHFPLQNRPLLVGFDAARNEVLDKIKSDWILWIDSDETLIHPERLLKYLRPNLFDGYAIAQHHMSAEAGPQGAGLLKTDLPCRLFRNNIGMRFYGMVHEHPCFSETKPPAQCFGIGEGVCIFHPGYMTEDIRRKRFDRNIALMIQDHQKYPNRSLGKYLWARDLIHMARYEREQTGGRVTPQIIAKCNEALKEYRELVKAGELRLVMESLPYATEATMMLHGDNGIQFQASLEATRLGIGDFNGQPPREVLRGILPTKEDVEAITSLLAIEKTKGFAAPYF